ncbi:fibronectin type-III domain-containing protein 3A-like [Engraulis encrasicolus]|uniref:fibronectin type-III domain-containing protein 3A-like n=1 Tax=Engraulis encrasicolus TaxID=184585 RepID=UPI002FD00D23
MMMDQTLEAQPLLPEVGFPHMLSSDYMQQMILVQVNPGDAFTVPTEGGHIQYIPGPAPVPMLSHNGSVGPLYLPPGYMPQVMEENSMRKMMLLPHGALEFHPSLHPPPPPHPHMPPHQHYPAHHHHHAALLPHPTHLFPPEMPPHYITHHMHALPAIYPEQELMCPSMAVPSLKSQQEQLHRRLKEQRSTPVTNGNHNAPSNVPPNTNGVHHNHNHSTPPPPLAKGLPPPPPPPLTATLHNGTHIKPPTPSPRAPRHNKLSGRTRATPPSDTESTDVEAGKHKVKEMLSSVSKPTVSGLTCRSAVLTWCPPIPSATLHRHHHHHHHSSASSSSPSSSSSSSSSSSASDKHPTARTHTPPPLLCYELALSHSGADGDYRPVYQGKDTTFTLGDLKPATLYYVRVCVACHSIKGSPSEAVTFTTLCAPPDAPPPPRVLVCTKSSVGLQWKAPNDNGARITAYLLECCEGRQSSFREVYCGPAKQHKVMRLSPATRYGFRVAARSTAGTSAFSEVLSCSTVGSAPPAPSPPSLSAAGASWISMTWGCSAPCGLSARDAPNYTLEMEETEGFQTKYSGQETCYTVKNLERSMSYRFRVSSTNAEGSSQPSAVVEYSTTADVPGRPSTPRLHTPALPHTIHTSWDAPEDDGGSPIMHYVLELSHTDDGWQVVYTGDQLEHVCEGLEPGTWYKLRVYCQSQGGQSLVSECLSVQTAPVHPGPCRALCVSGEATPSEITLSWDAPECLRQSEECVYAVELADTAEASHRQVYEGLERRCVVGSLLPATRYYFWARAANQAGWGPWSDMLEASTAPGPPEACGPPLLTVRGPTCVAISWECPPCDGARACEFRVEWGAQDDSLQVVYQGPSASWEATELTPHTQYSCRVQAVSEAGAGPFGDISRVTTPPSVPAVVECVEEMSVEEAEAKAEGDTETAGAAPSPSRLAVRWKEPCDHGAEITGYNIDLGEQLPLSVERTSHHVLESLQPNTTYRVRVRAVNSIGAGPYSCPLKLRTLPLPPDPPTLECTVCSPHTLKLRWGEGPARIPTPRGTQYCLHMQTGANRLVCVYSGSSHSFKLQRLSEATDYHFSIQAMSSAGKGPLSPLHTFTTTRSPPPQLKAPKIEAIQWNMYSITWETLQPMKGDPVLYTLQLMRGKEVERLYRGAATSYTWQGVPGGADWRVRVCAGRRRPEGAELWGAYSPGTALPPVPADAGRDTKTASSTLSASSCSSNSGGQCHTWWQLSDEHFALLVLVVFGVVAILFAVLIQYLFLSKD